MVLRLVLIFFPYSLNRQNRVLRTAVSFFPDAGLLAPEIAVNRVALRHFVVAIALGEIHASAIGEFPQHRQHLPLDVGGRTLLRIAEKISYSIFRRRNWVSSTFSSSSIVTGISAASVGQQIRQERGTVWARKGMVRK